MKQKILQITRHAKSDWSYEQIADIDRPLKEKGILRAYQVSHKVKKADLIPDLLISSPANRALHTAVIFARVLGVPLAKLSVNQQPAPVIAQAIRIVIFESVCSLV